MIDIQRGLSKLIYTDSVDNPYWKRFERTKFRKDSIFGYVVTEEDFCEHHEKNECKFGKQIFVSVNIFTIHRTLFFVETKIYNFMLRIVGSRCRKIHDLERLKQVRMQKMDIYERRRFLKESQSKK